MTQLILKMCIYVEFNISYFIKTIPISPRSYRTASGMRYTNRESVSMRCYITLSRPLHYNQRHYTAPSNLTGPITWIHLEYKYYTFYIILYIYIYYIYIQIVGYVTYIQIYEYISAAPRTAVQWTAYTRTSVRTHYVIFTCYAITADLRRLAA